MSKATKAAIEAHTKYNYKSYDRLYPYVPKGYKAKIKALAAENNETLNEFITTSIRERIERLTKNPPISN